MKKTIVLSVCAVLALSSCGTYAGTGAYAGMSLGSILGSAIGGISDGPRGSDIGTIVGMAGGAIIGGAIGAKADEKREADLEQYHRDREARQQARQARQQAATYEDQGTSASGFDASNSADDRIYDFTSSDYTSDYSAQQPTTVLPSSSSVEDMASGYAYTPDIEIRNARFVDTNQDNVISRGELCKVIFEVYNHGRRPIYDVQPTVVETTGNRHIYISPGMHVEKIEPGRGIRYTALVKADNRLRNGQIKICASVLQGNKAISQVSEFRIATRR